MATAASMVLQLLDITGSPALVPEEEVDLMSSDGSGLALADRELGWQWWGSCPWARCHGCWWPGGGRGFWLLARSLSMGPMAVIVHPFLHVGGN